mgnify:CR=1 FL=1
MSMGSNILLEDVAKLRMQNKRLRDEVARLRGLLAEIAHDCEHVGSIQHLDKAERRTWTSVANRIKAALTPQGGKGGVNGNNG